MSQLIRFFHVFLYVLTLVLVSVPVKANSNGSYSWDIDLDGRVDALTDGSIILRHSFGLPGAALTAGAVSQGSPLNSSEVEARVNLIADIADVDSNNKVDALTDGLILLRYMFGLTNESLIAGAVATDATRSSALEITQYLATYEPGQAPADSDGDGVADTVDATCCATPGRCRLHLRPWRPIRGCRTPARRVSTCEEL